MNKKSTIVIIALIIAAVLLLMFFNQPEPEEALADYKNEQYGFTLELNEEFNQNVDITENVMVVYFVSKEIQNQQSDMLLGVVGRIEVFSKNDFTKEKMLEAGDSYSLRYLGENNRFYFGWAHATDVQVPPGDESLTDRFRALETEFAEIIKTFKAFDVALPEVKIDTGRYVGLADNNFFEVKISGAPDEKAFRVFMITDEVRSKFESFNLQEGEEIKLHYIENEYGQNVVQDIEKFVEYKRISAEQAKTMIDREDNLIILDVRTPEEFSQGHIEGALNLPNEEIASSPPEILPDKNTTILIYCRSGNRSQQASQKLIDMGYSQVYDFGGIIDWPYETVK